MKFLEEKDLEKWNEFVLKNKNGNIFSTTEWYLSWNEDFKILVNFNNENEIEYGLIFKPQKKYFWSIIARPPFTLYNFPLIISKEKFKNEYDKNNFYKKIYLEILEEIKNYDFSDINIKSELNDTLPFTWYGYDFYPAYTYIIDDINWKDNISTMQRRKIKKGTKEIEENNFLIKTIDNLNSGFDLNSLIDFIYLNNDFFKLPAKEKLNYWLNYFLKNGKLKIFLILDSNNKIISSTINLYDNTSMYYIIGCIDKSFRKSNINSYLFELMIDDAFNKKLIFNFEGSVLPGVEKYFRSFGGKLIKFYRIIRVKNIFLKTLFYLNQKSKQNSYLKKENEFF